jgi:riboflavin kinase/FMN adenylyltransferase
LKIHFGYTDYNVPNSVITIGVFDGVHMGHVEIINRLIDLTKKLNGESVVVTFWPHPRLVLKQDASIKLINTLEEKQLLLQKYNIDHLVIIPFTEEFSALSSEEFIRDILVEKLHVRHLVVGFNHHFGRGREGNFDSMQHYAEIYGFDVEKLDAKVVENEKVSSTRIRNALIEGDIKTANSFLGYCYSLTGIIIEGNQIGREIGFPTANVQPDHDFKLLPKEGVYIVEVEFLGKKYPAMLNIGYKPTVNSYPSDLSIEVHIIEFTGDIYRENITIYFHKRLRDEQKFSGVEQLKKQLILDKEETIKYFPI